MTVDRSKLPALGPGPTFLFPAVHKVRLANGARIWTVEHHNVPVVALLLLVTAGSSWDPSDRPGLAALTADLLDEGSGDRSALDMHDALARIGAQFDTEVGPDATLMTVLTLPRFADRALALLSDMAVRPRLTPDDFTRVRDLRVNRLVQLRDVPSAQADMTFYEKVYGGHPYGHLAIGNEASLRTTLREEAAAFHRRAFTPGNATLIAVGAVPHEELTQLVAHAFESWRPAPDPDPSEGMARRDATLALPSPPDHDRVTIVHRPKAAQSELRIGHVGVPRSTPDYPALLVLNVALGGQFVSRINLNLRERKGYTYGARTSFDFRLGPGPFVLQAAVQSEATADAIRESLGELSAIRGERPVSAAELDLARAALTRGYARNFETAEQVARGVAQLALYDLPEDYFTRFVPSVLTVDADEVTRVADAHLHPDKAFTIVVGDREKIGVSPEALQIG